MKWEKVKTSLHDRKLLIDYMLSKKQLASEMSSLSNTISVSNSFRVNA